MDLTTILLILLAAGGAGAGGFLFAANKSKRDADDAEAKAKKILHDAELAAHKLALEAEDHAKKAEARAREADELKHKTLDTANREAAAVQAKAEKILVEVKEEEKQLRTKLESAEKRIVERETTLDKKIDEIDRRKTELETRAKEIEAQKGEITTIIAAQQAKLETVASLTKEEAKAELIAQIERQSSDELVKHIRAAEDKAKDEADKRARNIIVGAVQRLANEVTTESTVTLVSIPSDDVKGRIIGREGRNITAFEMATGVDVIVDDTPGAVIISGFDLVRRNIAKMALEKLIVDGRIHPARIEDAVKKATAEIDKMMREFGEKAVVEVGVVGLPPPLVKLLGRLNYRTSYGQNNLKHSIEVAFIGGMLASELGADVKIAKAACLLHDIGKAVDHEIEGPHAVLGAEILRKFQLPEPIIHAVEAHHEDVELKTVEAFIVQAADAISGARPGARRESTENYIQRLTQLEGIATGFTGVEKAFAIQAGREVRVVVRPETIDDLGAIKLSKEIAGKIEKEMAYPGQIKVNVIRETRAVDYAK